MELRIADGQLLAGAGSYTIREELPTGRWKLTFVKLPEQELTIQLFPSDAFLGSHNVQGFAGLCRFLAREHHYKNVTYLLV